MTFVQRDAVAHTATADDEAFDTGLLEQGERKVIALDRAGTYSYYCRPHPFMKATITVAEESGGGGSGY